MHNIFILILTTTILFSMSNRDIEKRVDDWDYNVSKEFDILKSSRAMPKLTTVASPMLESKNLGFSVGGAKDADNFYENLKHGYLPKISSITYEGVFYDHYFKSEAKNSCKTLFCPSYTTHIRENPYTKELEYYLSVGLNSGIKLDDFKRKKLNIVVVLDISGSMGAPFDKYYYDKKEKIDTVDQKRSKIQIANRSIVNMIDNLKGEDRFGVVLFDQKAYNAKPLRPIKNTDIEATKRHILALKSRGGTNWSEGYSSAIELFNTLETKFKDQTIYENRVIFLTDAMPNRGELNKGGLFDLVDRASKDGIYTTFIGIGVDFNSDLVEAVSKTKGANYYSVHSESEFQKRLDKEFDFMVTPLVFDLSLKLSSRKNRIDAIYGSPDADHATGEVIYVNTLFPSPSTKEAVKGGIILAKVANRDELTLTVTYRDRDGKSYKDIKRVIFKDSKKGSNSAIKKAILLSDYVTLMQNFLIDRRIGCQDEALYRSHLVGFKECMVYPPNRPEMKKIQSYERGSCPLVVSDGYKKLISLFLADFKNRAQNFKDDDFKKEIDALKLLLSSKNGREDQKIDDWSTKR